MKKQVPLHFCCYCNAYHCLHYVQDQYSKKHLWVECPRGHYAIAFVPKLDIPTVESRAKRKLDAEQQQAKLL